MLLWTLGVVALIGIGLWSLQRRLIYFPGRAVPPVEQILGDAREVQLSTADGLTLGGWILPPGDGQPVVIVFNGNAGTRAGRAPLAAALSDARFGVLLLDYRGYAGNPGSPSEAGLALDARAARQFVTDRYPEHPLVYFGESLGAAVAIELAQEFPPDVLILRSPFTSIAAVAAEHYPIVPRLLLRDTYPSDGRIGSVDAPVLVIAGSADSIVPIEQSRRIHELASNSKELLVVDGANHNDFALLAGQEMIDVMLRFVIEHTAG